MFALLKCSLIRSLSYCIAFFFEIPSCLQIFGLIRNSWNCSWSTVSNMDTLSLRSLQNSQHVFVPPPPSLSLYECCLHHIVLNGLVFWVFYYLFVSVCLLLLLFTFVALKLIVKKTNYFGHTCCIFESVLLNNRKVTSITT